MKADDVEARSEVSFQVSFPVSGDVLAIDVTEDIKFWVEECGLI